MKISFLGLLTLILITLKLTGYVMWPWVWVFAPVWIPLALVGVIALLLLLAAKLSDA